MVLIHGVGDTYMMALHELLAVMLILRLNINGEYQIILPYLLGSSALYSSTGLRVQICKVSPRQMTSNDATSDMKSHSIMVLIIHYLVFTRFLGF